MTVNRLGDWQEESQLLSSLRELSVVEIVRAKAPVEAKAKRVEAEALQRKVNQLLAEAAHIDSILLAASTTPIVTHVLPAEEMFL